MKASSYLVLALLVTVCFTVATTTQPRALNWSKRAQADTMLKALLGDTRRSFSGYFYRQADVAFHSGYYPSVFDRREEAASTGDGHDAHDHENHGHGEPHVHTEDCDHEHDAHVAERTAGPARDWIERFGRHFRHTEHTELSGQKTREILPWLRLSAELDPQNVQTYIVAAFWLRSELGKVEEAEQFLRDGLRANPRSYEILFALGRLKYENRYDATGARNLWEVALRRWQEQEQGKDDPDISALREIALNLARLEEEQGSLTRAIHHLELAKKISPQPEAVQKWIDELKAKYLGTAPVTNAVPP
jgi:tetratricopeptide (TPR) repeat protein